MMLEGKKLRWYFNVGKDTAQVLMTEDVSSEHFNKLVLERWETCTPTHICLAQTLLTLFSSFIYFILLLYLCILCVCRTLQYGQMAMSTDPDGAKIVKQSLEAGGENGLLNLPAEETVFYVGGYPSTFSVSNAKRLSVVQNRIETFDLNQ